MAIAVWGVEADLGVSEWAEVQAAQSLVAPLPAGITSGFVASAATGTRLVSVTAGEAAAPGVRIVSDAAATVTVDANTTADSIRLDVVALQIDWTGGQDTAGTVVVVKGQTIKGDVAVAPTLTQAPGIRWQIPICTVEVTTNRGQLSTSRDLDDISARADTGKVAATPAGGWALAGTQPLSVRRRAGHVELSGRLSRSGGAIAANAENDFGGLRLIPDGFLPPDYEVTLPVFWIASASASGVGFIRITRNGFAYITPVTRQIASGDTIRIHATWEV